MAHLQHYFSFQANNTTYRQETLAGVTTFVTTVNIFAVNPAILEAAGIARDAIRGDG